MNNPNDKVEAIFEAALALKTDAERNDYLARACPDPNLRREVESLLEAHYNPDSVFTEETIVVELPPTEGPGTRIGRYKLLQQIGEGGMGLVYMADQEEPVRRRVALKIIKLGMDTKSVVARFEAERQALALMDHPNIAKVLDGGATETGRPYFVMELVQGVPITTFCDKAKLPAKERLKLFIQVCQAIQSAHQKGIIHRDIKPSNVLVTLHDGVPVPKVIDFGIAKATNQKLTEKTLFTNFASMIGTPAYMSPEQAEMSGLDVDTRTDIYALGVLLYELLTGSTPFPEKRLRSLGYGEMQRVIMEEEPERPSTRLSTMANEQKTIVARNCGEELVSLSNLLRGDLDWIVMRCLEKERTRRYETANGLAADLKRHLDNEPVVARPPSATYKFQKAIRRNKLAFASATAVVGALLIGMGASTWQATVASRARNRERAANQELRVQIAETESAKHRADQSAQAEVEQRQRIGTMLEQMQLQNADVQLGSQQSALGVAYLVRMLRANPSNEVAAARLASAVVRPFCTPVAEPLMHDSAVSAAQFSADSLRLVTIADSAARVWDARTGRPLTDSLRHEQRLRSVQFSPDGSRIVTASDDKTARIWDARTGQPLGEPLRHDAAVLFAQFSPDGSEVVTASLDRTARVWDARTTQALGRTMQHNASVVAARFNWDGSRILTASNDGAVRTWDSRTGNSLQDAVNTVKRGEWLGSAQFHPSGLRLATCSAVTEFDWYGFGYQSFGVNEKSARVWDSRTGSALTRPLLHDNVVLSVRFSPDGLRVITSSMDKTSRIWDARTGLPLASPLRHGDFVLDAEFSPDGLRVVTASMDNTARVWDSATGLPLTEPLRHEGGVRSASFSPDGSLVVTTSQDKTARLWDVRTAPRLAEPLQHQDAQTYAEFSLDGSKVVTASYDKTARVWDARSGLPVGEPLRHEQTVWSATFSPDGLKVVTACMDKTARVWDALTGRQLGEPIVHQDQVVWAQFSPDGASIETASRDNTARLWDATNGKPLTDALSHRGAVRAVQFSRDGSKVVTASMDKTARVWDARTGKPLTEPLQHENGVIYAEFSPDGLQVVTASLDRTARLWDVRTGRQLINPLRHEAELWSAQFSPDGLRIATASADKTARIWDVRTGQALGKALQHESQIYSAQFSPDGLRVVTASSDNTARVWDAFTGLPMGEPLLHRDQVWHAQFSPDGLRVLTFSWDNTARIWGVPRTPVPVPGWFLDWAEARVGRRIDASGEPYTVPFIEQFRQRENIQSRASKDFFTQLAQWIQADLITRSIAPGSSETTAEFVERRLKENTDASLHEALVLCPTNSSAWANEAFHVVKQLADNTRSDDDPPLLQSFCEQVAWGSRALRAEHADGGQNDLLLMSAERAAERALHLDANQPDAWRAVGTVQFLRNFPSAALASLDRVLSLRPEASEAWELKGDILAQQERYQEALEVYSQWLALMPMTNKVQGCPRLQALDKHAAVCRKLGRWTEAIADIRAGGVPERDAATDARLIDLSAFYNLELGGGDLAAMLTGVRTLDGTQFDARGCLFLASSKLYPNRVPDQMLGIPVGTKGKRVHLLHGTFWGVFDPMGTRIGKYILHFADGTSLERSLVLGQDVLDASADPPQPGDGNPNMVWAVQDPKAEPRYQPQRLYHTTWDNPHPETEIVTLDFISLKTPAAPFLVAVTIE